MPAVEGEDTDVSPPVSDASLASPAKRRSDTTHEAMNAGLIKKVHDARAGKIHVKFTLFTLLAAWWALLTNRLLSLGRTALLADLKSKIHSVNTNVGLVSALILTVVASEFTSANDLMITDPDWVGWVYFQIVGMSTAFLFFATLMSVFVNVLLDLTNSDLEARYLVRIGHTEIRRLTFELMIYGLLMFLLAVFVWCFIVLLDLDASDSCLDDDCSYFPVTLLVTFIFLVVIILWITFNTSILIAKLYKAHHKFLDGTGETTAANVIVDLRAKELWPLIESYYEVDGATATLTGYREYVMRMTNGNAIGMSYLCDKLAERLFEEYSAILMAKDHDALVAELGTLKMHNKAFESYPEVLEHNRDSLHA